MWGLWEKETSKERIINFLSKPRTGLDFYRHKMPKFSTRISEINKEGTHHIEIYSMPKSHYRVYELIY